MTDQADESHESVDTAEDARRRRWRLALGEPAEEPLEASLDESETDMDEALAALYDVRPDEPGPAGRPVGRTGLLGAPGRPLAR